MGTSEISELFSYGDKLLRLRISRGRSSSSISMMGTDWPLTPQMIGMSESGPMTEEQRRLTADARRCRDALWAINQANQKSWG